MREELQAAISRARETALYHQEELNHIPAHKCPVSPYGEAMTYADLDLLIAAAQEAQECRALSQRAFSQWNELALKQADLTNENERHEKAGNELNEKFHSVMGELYNYKLENKKLREQLAAVESAWYSLPETTKTLDELESWLLNKVKPAIKAIITGEKT